jgi:hypothetical protein
MSGIIMVRVLARRYQIKCLSFDQLKPKTVKFALVALLLSR